MEELYLIIGKKEHELEAARSDLVRLKGNLNTAFRWINGIKLGELDPRRFSVDLEKGDCTLGPELNNPQSFNTVSPPSKQAIADAVCVIDRVMESALASNSASKYQEDQWRLVRSAILATLFD